MGRSIWLATGKAFKVIGIATAGMSLVALARRLLNLEFAGIFASIVDSYREVANLVRDQVFLPLVALSFPGIEIPDPAVDVAILWLLSITTYYRATFTGDARFAWKEVFPPEDTRLLQRAWPDIREHARAAGRTLRVVPIAPLILFVRAFREVRDFFAARRAARASIRREYSVADQFFEFQYDSAADDHLATATAIIAPLVAAVAFVLANSIFL